jgi:hypothetical protein
MGWHDRLRAALAAEAASRAVPECAAANSANPADCPVRRGDGEELAQSAQSAGDENPERAQRSGDEERPHWQTDLMAYAVERLGPEPARRWPLRDTLTLPGFSVATWPPWDTPTPGDITSLRAEINAAANFARGYLPQIPDKARDGRH